MDAIEEAANLLFPPHGQGRGRTLNVKFGTPARGRAMSALEMARTIVHAETEIREGRARPVFDID